jgi:predicted O-methyltransferase YrrM
MTSEQFGAPRDGKSRQALLSATAPDVREHVVAAYALGQELDLRDCVYGPATGGNRGYINETLSYYHLLAGHVLKTKAASVLEVGTHYGGSTLALLAGLRAGGEEEGRIVTMDVTRLNEERLAVEPEIRRLVGDARDPASIRAARALLGSERVDLLYIDALKDPAFVLETIRNVVDAGLAIEWIILDDVQTNDAMRGFWADIEREFDESALLISRDYPHMRNPEMGYGIIHVPSCRDFAATVERLLGSASGSPARDRTASLSYADLGTRLRSAGGGYSKAYPEKPRDESSDRELDALFAIARDFCTGAGDIVETGGLLGATTHALCHGLAANDRVPVKTARITSVDHFVNDSPAFERLFAGRVPAGGSSMPVFVEAIEPYRDHLNIVDRPLNIFRWCGRPIEVLVLGSQRTPQAFAASISEFGPYLAPGRSVVVMRDIRKTTRPWVAYGTASLADHLELIDAGVGVAVYGVVSPFAPWKVARIIQNDFSHGERVALVRSLAAPLADDNPLKLDLVDVAVRLANKFQNTAATDELFEEFRRLIPNPAASPRLARLAKALGRE